MEKPRAQPGLRSKAQHGSAALMQHVRKRVADGTWPAGYRLPAERDLVEQFGIARNTLRKVMDQLEADGAITRHVGRGTFVAETLAPAHDAAQTLLQRIHGASPAEVMELRLLIEPQFVELAATRASGRDLQQIAHCLDASEKAATVLDFEYWDGMLHQAILSAAHNTLLTDLYEAINGVRKQPEWETLKQRSLTPERLARYRAQHRAIVLALRQRDAGAASAAIRQHLLEVRAGMIGEV
ncbi:MAG: putative L-lactate dehydrogenase operon regulatory protein [Paracidovorax wautersii]|uniref:Putative L-lactate dehydrogenase operon regulatory protein n=1 Tax=Paracidovorax wautersii TaxID=1177982 RepID=A0A7V8FMU8_9BURK|nr:MAG: putative L-lactate dehydrogenase operon regulatory protein [Paracidovorax wautersii]